MNELTARHIRAITLLAEGHSRASAASRMKMSDNAIGHLLRDSCDLLDARSMPHLVLLAAARGFIAVDVYADPCPTCGRAA